MTPSWSNHMESIILLPYIFAYGFDWAASPGRTHTFWSLGLSKWIYFSSPVTIQYRKPFLLYLLSKISHIVFRRSIVLSVKSCGSQFPFFWTIAIRCNRFKMHCWVTFNASANCVSLRHGSSSSMASKSSSLNLFGAPLRFLSSKSKL